MQVNFTIPGIPKGKGRPIFSTFGGHVSARTPKDTVLYENYVKLMYREQAGTAFFDGAVRAEITGYFPIPKSWSKKKTSAAATGKMHHAHKIDCDNLAKVILDALNQIAYSDDGQVSELCVSKVYGEQARVEVRLTNLSADE